MHCQTSKEQLSLYLLAASDLVFFSSYSKHASVGRLRASAQSLIPVSPRCHGILCTCIVFYCLYDHRPGGRVGRGWGEREKDLYIYPVPALGRPAISLSRQQHFHSFHSLTHAKHERHNVRPHRHHAPFPTVRVRGADPPPVLTSSCTE